MLVSKITPVELTPHGDQRGSLIVLESLRTINFDIKRVYYIYGTQESVARGFHAHRTLKQLLIAVSGEVDLICETKTERKVYHLSDPTKGIIIEGLVWREMHNFSKNAVLLVLASEYYDESDYIRNYDQFCAELGD